MPADVRLRVAMQHQDWVTVTTLNQVDCGFPSLNLLAIETVKHILQINVFTRPIEATQVRSRCSTGPDDRSVKSLNRPAELFGRRRRHLRPN